MHWRLLISFSLLGAAACDSDGERRPIGATCASNGQCVSGVCGGGMCLDPDLDTDADGLINRVEAALGTDPVRTDSDGDGTDDPAEIGDVDAPVDSDGDGKLDAIESAIADVDSDCIVDQDDPNDGVADPPSERFPEACGSASVGCAGNPLAGGCAAALGEMIFGCFMPAGGCEIIVNPDQSGGIVWENGARIDIDADARQGTYRGPTGTVCGTTTDSEGESSTLTPAQGPSFVVTDEPTTGTTVITCPDGAQVVRLTDDLKDSFEACAGSSESCLTSTPQPGLCTDDADCNGGDCCVIPGAGGFCLPAGQCPTG